VGSTPVSAQWVLEVKRPRCEAHDPLAFKKLRMSGAVPSLPLPSWRARGRLHRPAPVQLHKACATKCHSVLQNNLISIENLS
jgi:hypothetical protein